MSHPPHAESAAKISGDFHTNVVAEVQEAVENDHIVVVGMGWNPHVGKTRKALDAAGITYTYLEYGNYSNQWHARLAIKMWSQWPTFPQVFVDGTLIGGGEQCRAAIEDGTLKNA